MAAAVMSPVANCHRDPKTGAFTPDDFNPMVLRPQRADVIEVNEETVELMREAFMGRHDPRQSASTDTSQ